MVIHAEGLCKSYEDNQVLNNIDLEVKRGQMIALTGPSGCGKSTLLNILGLIDQPDAGTLLLFGNPAPKPDSLAARKLLGNQISFLFQNFALAEDYTVRENLKMALRFQKRTRSETDILIQQALRDVRMEGSENRKVYTLSGGQQQRIALARILLRPGGLVLCDEPTASLDEKNEALVLSLLRQITDQGSTVFIATHQLSVVQACDSCIDLSR